MTAAERAERAARADALCQEAHASVGAPETGVALVHGTAFGSPGSMRLSYAASNRELEDAVSRIQDFCAGVR